MLVSYLLLDLGMPIYHFLIIANFLFIFFFTIDGASFTIINKCSYTVWPAILSGAGTVTPLPTTGFTLQSGESNTFSLPTSWSGRLWGRTLCSSDDYTARFSCVTGDCGSGTVACNGSGAKPPTSLAEFTLNGANGMDFYDVSLVDGYNLPMLVENGNCTSTGCSVDLNGSCPDELKVMGADGVCVACKSACEAFREDVYCCTGIYDNPSTCKPTPYSELFKNACPLAYSYAYDDGTSTFTCTSASANYIITFCSDSRNSRKAIGGGGAGGDASRASSTTSAFLITCLIWAAIWLALDL